jgi:hypothetical protein
MKNVKYKLQNAKFKGIVKKHKKLNYVTVDPAKMNALSKKEYNKKIKTPKGKCGLEKAKRVKCKNCSMCGGCGYVFEDK